MKLVKFLKMTGMLCWLSQLALIAGENKVLIIAGHGGLEKFQKTFYHQAKDLRQILIDEFDYTAQDIQVFVAANPDSAPIEFPQCTAANIRKYFQEKGRKLSPENTLFCFLIGHGSYDNEWGKFNIVGKDLRDFDYALLLNKLKTRRVCFVNMASSSGPFIDKLSKKNRIILTATRNGFEKNATQFTAQFLDVLSATDATDLNKDGLISVAEIFIATRDRVVKFYDSKKQLRPEHPLLDDDGDGFGTEMPDLLEGDGLLAGEIYLNQRHAQSLHESDQEKVAQTPADRQKSKILAQIKALKKKKSTFAEDDYYDALEKLMIALASVNQGNN